MRSVTSVESILRHAGPQRAGAVAAELTKAGATPAAARKTIQRAREPVQRLPLRLPHNEQFLFLAEQQQTSSYFERLSALLRETGSAYGCALDGMRASGGFVPAYMFASRAGSPLHQRGHIPSHRIQSTLESIGFLTREPLGSIGECIRFAEATGETVRHPSRLRAVALAEQSLIAAIEKWAANLGLASFNSIEVRSPLKMPMVGNHHWDLVGPSYLSGLVTRTGGVLKPGFLVADVCLDGDLSRNHVEFALRKGATHRNLRNARPLLQMLVADRFSVDALKAGKSDGLIMATSGNLFGDEVAKALADLIGTMTDAARQMSKNPELAYASFDRLSKLEGSAAQLRGPLFELVAFHAVSLLEPGTKQFSQLVRDPFSGGDAEIDILIVQERMIARAIECKGRLGSLRVDLNTVKDWVTRQVPRMDRYLTDRYRNTPRQYEIWTTGTFEAEARDFLVARRDETKAYAIDWKDGAQVRAYCDRCPTRRPVEILDANYFST